MTGSSLLEALKSASADQLFTTLYGDYLAPRQRYTSLVKGFLHDFPDCSAGLRVFTAAGRSELGGNHTDHNCGKVLAASIQLDAVAIVAPRSDQNIIFRSTGYPDVRVDLSDLSFRPSESGCTEALVRGIAAEFQSRGFKLAGFTANAASTVLAGSGLSSSAAVEVLIAAIFNGLYVPAQQSLSALELAKISQKAENRYFGKPCGLMDQVASATGGAIAIDLADPEQPVVTAVNFDPLSAGYVLCVVDCGGSHADLTDEYAAVPREMTAVASALGKPTLRELSRDLVLKAIPQLRPVVGDRAILRALHYFDENDRVEAMLSALQSADRAAKLGQTAHQQAAIEYFLDLVDLSGKSSWELLQNVSTLRRPKDQGLALAIALSRDFFAQDPEVGGCGKRGVSRVHGGGFAGTIQSYLPLAALPAYQARLNAVFGQKAVTVLNIRPVGARELDFKSGILK